MSHKLNPTPYPLIFFRIRVLCWTISPFQNFELVMYHNIRNKDYTEILFQTRRGSSSDRIAPEYSSRFGASARTKARRTDTYVERRSERETKSG